MGQARALDFHRYSNRSIGISKPGKNYGLDLTHVDAVHANGGFLFQPFAIRHVKVKGGFLRKQRPAGQQIKERQQNERGHNRDCPYPELSPNHPLLGRHSPGLYRALHSAVPPDQGNASYGHSGAVCTALSLKKGIGMIEDLLRPQHLLLILLIVVFLFGGKKLPEVAKGLGEGIRNFKTAMKGEPEKEAEKPVEKPAIDKA